MLKVVKNFDDYEYLKKMSSNGLVFLLKHSLTCPISATAYNEFVSFSNANKNLPCFVVHLQGARGVCNKIASDTGVVHESPQVLVFKDSVVIYNKSHFYVTKINLEKVVRNN